LEQEEKMNCIEPHTPGRASAMPLSQFWSAHLDDLERHLSANTWALTAVTVVLIAYPVARIVISAIPHEILPHGIVPDVVRTLLQLM
jgi:hypothetical protein